jgi:hypothetical protein
MRSVPRRDGRGAPAVPQAVGDLILAQTGRLGDLSGCVFAGQRGGADAGQRSTGQQRLERPQCKGLLDLGVCSSLFSSSDGLEGRTE